MIIAFTYREGSIVVTYVATFDPAATNETASTIQAAIQQELFVNGTGTFLGQYQLQGTRQTALIYQGKSILSSYGEKRSS
jgi:hypothetical protein